MRTRFVRTRVSLAVCLTLLGLALVGCGARQTVVPDMTGKSVPEARASLAEAGLLVGSMRDFKEYETTPVVFAQSPEAGSRVGRGAIIDLVLTYDCYRCR